VVLQVAITAAADAASADGGAAAAEPLGAAEALGAAELAGPGSAFFPQPAAQIRSASAPASIVVVVVRIGFGGMVGAGAAIVKGA
jgi:hypothetical protein